MDRSSTDINFAVKNSQTAINNRDGGYKYPKNQSSYKRIGKVHDVIMGGGVFSAVGC